jgi:hypothetical protein
LVRAAALRLPALIPALIFLPMVLAPPLNHDVAAVLEFSQRWLAGEHLYSDLIDVNPPLIFVLNLLPAWIADITGLDGVLAVQLCVLAWGAVSFALSLRVRDRAAESDTNRAFLDVLPLLFLLCAGYDFGQREHLMAVSALPYLLCAARRSTGAAPRGRIGAALFAAIGFALKPYFLGIPLLVELAVIAGRSRGPGGLAGGVTRSLRDPVPWVLAAVWVAYVASIPVLFPDFFGVVVPLVWDFYLDRGLSVGELLLVPRMATILCLLVPLLWWSFRRSALPAPVLPRILGLAAIGGVMSVIVQHKGWTYHILPVQLFTLGLAGTLLADWLDRQALARTAAGAYRMAGILTAGVAFFFIATGEAPWREIDYDKTQVAGLTDMLNEAAAGERVLVFSPGIYPIYPALNYAGVRATLRTMNMWMLQGAYQTCTPGAPRYRETWEMGRPEFFVYRTVAEDFARAPPAAVVVDRQPGIPWCGSEFDFIEYFKRHPLFAEVWSHYELTAEWDRYRLYTRKD